MGQSLSGRIQAYLKARVEKREEHPHEQKISVNEAIGAIAFYYEKIRNVVDYQDEHLIRQNAIRRILGRRIILEGPQEERALAILKELVRYRYFPNNSLPVRAGADVAGILRLYMDVIRELSLRHELTDKDQDWLISMAACSIDEYLVPMKEERALVNLMYDVLEPIVAGKNGTDDSVRKLQIYIAAYRVLLRPDIDRLRHFLLIHNFPEWSQFEQFDAKTLADEYSGVARKIDLLIQHPLNKKMLPRFKRFRIPFVVLFTILKDGKEKILETPDVLEKEVTRICEAFYAVQKKRLYGRTIRAFIYIFLTKMVLGLAVELPYDLVTLKHVNMVPLLVNIIFPPIFLACMTLSVKFPSKENTKMIGQAIKEIVYTDTPREVFVPQRYSAKKHSPFVMFVFTILYILLFVLSFGVVGWVLNKLDFNLMSGVVFFVFFSLIAFFGINLRRSVLDLVIIKPKTNLLMTLIESFFLPIVSVGRWLSFNISRVNVFVFIFDVLIELPLQALLEITEEWFAFLKDKKDEIDT